jgi:predicted RNA-binding protein with PIN domain
MASKRVWIMDGHNMIFAIPPLRDLQRSDRRDEARRGLSDRLEPFALARGEKVLLVFDGNDMASNPYEARTPLFEILYARRGEGAADHRILQEANRLLQRGLPVTVVTDDVRTLAGELPRGVLHLGVQAFWLKFIEPESGEDGKRIAGDFSEVERAMVQTALAEPLPEPRRLVGPSRAGGSPGVPPRAPGTTGPELISRKREKGRLRQERRLKRRRNNLH